MNGTGQDKMQYDVAIIGGGPAGSTCAALLRKYNPEIRVVVLEKEKFPRDHVGESHLPGISAILNEMGCWDDVEAAGFPVKIGASYTWGRSADRWDFDFYPLEKWVDEPRPAKYEGQRKFTAFQVDRAIYDNLLLRHAEKLGAEVREETKVTRIHSSGDRIDGFELASGEIITARYYVDCSGTVGIVRRHMGIETEAPKELRNIAIWDYWTNAEWAVEIGVGATRVQVRSLPYGWIWFIPLGPTRTSIGLICPAEHYKKLGMSPADLYHKAVHQQEDIERLIRNATAEGNVQSTKDWSFVADRLYGENWFLSGECIGFADPILAAGMTLHQGAARYLAYVILELQRGELDANWLCERYNTQMRENVWQHIRFAQFWYSSNGCFTDLQEHCASIAREAGLKLTPAKAWQWLSQGGFIHQNAVKPGAGSFDITTAKLIVEQIGGDSKHIGHSYDGYNQFKLNLANVTEEKLGHPQEGRIHEIPCYRRGHRYLPRDGYFGGVISALKHSSDLVEILEYFRAESKRISGDPDQHIGTFFQTLDVMVQEGWVERKKRKDRPFMTKSDDGSGRIVRLASKTIEDLTKAGRGDLQKSRIDD